MIELPKPDRRYKPGRIVKDKKGTYRGHPITVTPTRLKFPSSTHIDALRYNMNPPIVVSAELSKHLEGKW